MLRSVSSSRDGPDLRSEEHTSELQSQSNLVCRLLLEKKKNHQANCPLLNCRVLTVAGRQAAAGIVMMHCACRSSATGSARRDSNRVANHALSVCIDHP